MTRITSTTAHEDGSVTVTSHDHPGKRLVMGSDPNLPFILADDDPREEVEHVTLVAIVTTGADVEQAQRVLVDHMPSAGKYGLPPGWDSWWVADDTLGYGQDHDVRRIDGSDNDPAVFCNRRTQARSARMLYALGLTGECNADLTVGPQRRLAEVLDGMVSLALEADRLRREIGGEV